MSHTCFHGITSPGSHPDSSSAALAMAGTLTSRCHQAAATCVAALAHAKDPEHPEQEAVENALEHDAATTRAQEALARAAAKRKVAVAAVPDPDGADDDDASPHN